MRHAWHGRHATSRALLAGETSAAAASSRAAQVPRDKNSGDKRPGDRKPRDQKPRGTKPTDEPPARDMTARGRDLTAAAFFDVDNTMMQGASLFHFARGLAARHFFTTGDLVRFAARQIKFRVLGSEDMADASDARAAALAFVAGREVAEVVRLCEEIYDELMADRIYPGTRRLAAAHLAAGQRVYLVTATPIELATIIASRLGLTGALGTVAETAYGRFTGRLVGDLLHGPAKAAAVRALAAQEGLDLTRCTAYSDSINDLPMLRAVGTAVAINPDSALRRVAARSGWEVHDFRVARQAARIGVPSLIGAGLVGGAVVAGAALRRRYR